MTSLRAIARDLAFRHVGGTAVVLLYHRVADLERDPQLLAVGRANFESQVRMLAGSYRMLSLTELLAALQRRTVPDRAVVVTFDDGYADNLTAAEPVLAAHGVPATVFVSSGHVGAEHGFWWDELERLVLCPGSLPRHIDLETPGGSYSARLTDCRTYSDSDAERNASWNVLAPDANARQELYRRLAAFLRPLAPGDRESALEQLRGLAQIDSGDTTDPRATHRPLTEQEVARLDASTVVDVGAHTLRHAVLSSLTPDEQRAEIAADRDALATMCGRSIGTFSYPYGDLDTYTDETVGIVRACGFAGACANHLGLVKPWTDPYRLPRAIVRDADGAALAGMLERWFRDPK